MVEMQTKSVEVPKPGDPDRKRVMNVLAQRRYRQRRRERLHALERKSAAMSTSIKEQSSISSEAQVPTGEGMEVSTVHQEGDLWPTWDGTSPSSSDSWNSLGATMSIGPENCVSGSFDPVFFDMSPFCNIEGLGSELQTLESSQYTFPDDASLHVPELKVIKAGLDIAALLNCTSALWDPAATRTFSSESVSSPLPLDLEPTEVQRRIPHHPVFDIFPWPSVRNKLIYIFAQPAEQRPKAARDPMAVIQLQYDLEHTSEGVRIASGDCYCGDNWEVGQIVFQNWWWALDRNIVERSNMLRARRGAPRLQLMPA